jgi:ATP-binding cassette subfamily F protein uup
LVRDYIGTLSEYADCLVDKDRDSSGLASSINQVDTKQSSYKEDRKTRTEKKNLIKKLERDMERIESDIQKLKEKKSTIQIELDRSADKGWSVLADLSDQINKISDDIDNKEQRWLEMAEQLETETNVE